MTRSARLGSRKPISSTKPPTGATARSRGSSCLKAELEAVFAEVPANDERFTLMLVPSRPARLWIDLFTYGAIEETSGAYLFIRNSESGRRTLYSTNSVSEMADRITLYMAHEIVRRERAEAALLEPLTREEQPQAAPPPARLGMGVVVAAFIIGLLTGAAGLFAAAWLVTP